MGVIIGLPGEFGIVHPFFQSDGVPQGIEGILSEDDPSVKFEPGSSHGDIVIAGSVNEHPDFHGYEVTSVGAVYLSEFQVYVAGIDSGNDSTSVKWFDNLAAGVFEDAVRGMTWN